MVDLGNKKAIVTRSEWKRKILAVMSWDGEVDRNRRRPRQTTVAEIFLIRSLSLVFGHRQRPLHPSVQASG